MIIIYLFTYLLIYLFTYLLIIYLLILFFIYFLFIYLLIYFLFKIIHFLGDRIEVTGIFKANPNRLNSRMRTLRAVYKTHIDCIHFR